MEESGFSTLDIGGRPAGSNRAVPPQSWDLEKEYQSRRDLYDRARADLEQILKRLIEDLAKQELFRAALTNVRVKDCVKIREKAERHSIPLDRVLDQLDDLVGGRIVCNNLEDIEKIIEVVKRGSQWKVISVDGPEKISFGTSRGYRARHIVVEMIVYRGYHTAKVLAEIQIRTLLEDGWAHLAYDDFYKPEEKGGPTWLDEQMRKMSDDLYALDLQAQRIRGAVEKRYADIKQSLNLAVVSKIADQKYGEALTNILGSMSSDDPGMQLAALETFLNNSVLWHEGMRDFAAAAKEMDEWIKIRLTEKIGALNPDQAVEFQPVIEAFIGD
jgi:ppGpp synthetase/RelA/SpoT-type nucleotidyltranferase